MGEEYGDGTVWRGVFDGVIEEVVEDGSEGLLIGMQVNW